IVLVAVCSTLSSSPAWAQDGGAATIRGRVLDPSRAPVEGAHVTLFDESSRPFRSTVTDDRGEFEFSVDREHRYAVLIVAPGFVDASDSISVPQTEPSREFVLAIAGVR